MTHVEQVIREAVEKGGYDIDHIGSAAIALKLSDNEEYYTVYYANGAEVGHSFRLSSSWAFTVLDTLFWQALGKARGWDGERQDFFVVSKWQPEWKYYWFCFIDHLAGGKSAEDFFKDL